MQHLNTFHSLDEEFGFHQHFHECFLTFWLMIQKNCFSTRVPTWDGQFEMQDIPAVGPCPDADQPKYLPNWIRNALSCNSRYTRMIRELDVFSSDFARVQILHQMLTVVIALALGNFDRLVHFVLEGLFATLSWCASAASIINRSTAYRCTFRQRLWESAWHGIGSNLMLL